MNSSMGVLCFIGHQMMNRAVDKTRLAGQLVYAAESPLRIRAAASLKDRAADRRYRGRESGRSAGEPGQVVGRRAPPPTARRPPAVASCRLENLLVAQSAPPHPEGRADPSAPFP